MGHPQNIADVPRQAARLPDLQRVADACVAHHGSQHPVVLPFDLCAPHSVMEAQAKTADEAFGSAGVDYMVHVAGEAAPPTRGSLLWDWAATLAWLAGRVPRETACTTRVKVLSLTCPW